MSLMGGHLGQLADQEEKKSKAAAESTMIKEVATTKKSLAKSSLPPQQPPPSQEQMQRWLADPRLRAILGDPATQHKLDRLQSLPMESRRQALEQMCASDPGMLLLVQAGILRI